MFWEALRPSGRETVLESNKRELGLVRKGGNFSDWGPGQ